MGNVIYDTTYEALIETIQNYYGPTSIGWENITASGVLTNDRIIEEINKLPNCHAIANHDGTVRVIQQTYSTGSTSSLENLAQSINSNAQTGTANKTATMTINAPASTTYEQGVFKATKNINATTTKQFICKEVVPAVAAAGVGIKLGKTIDSALYNANPDFWDSHGLQGLDPNTWSGITQDMNGSLGELALGTCFNMLFGIDPTTKKAQAYIDENAFAYLTTYMQREGFLSGNIGAHVSDEVFNSLEYKDYYKNPTPLYSSVAGYMEYTSEENINESFTISNGYMLALPTPLSDDTTVIMGVSTQSGSKITCTYSDHFEPAEFPLIYTIEVDGVTYYHNLGGLLPSTRGAFLNFSTIANYTMLDSNSLPDLFRIIFGGNIATDQLDGVGNQDGATLPQLNNAMSVNDVLNALRNQYPDLFNSAVTNDVAQPDGSTTTYTYLPIPYPNTNGAGDTHPTGGTGTQTQSNTEFDPQNAPQSDYDYFWNLIDPTKPTFPDWDDGSGGDGLTPTPTIPDGSASALWKIYNPSQAELDSFGAWLWSPAFVDQILKAFNDPMQAIIGLHKIFVTPPVSGSGSIKVGYLTSSASANYVSAQYVDLDCGSVTVYEYFGNVFDYEPYTKIHLYLPFIGIVQLDNSDIMRGKISVKYHVDVLTGSCLAEVKVTRDGAGGTLYTFSGNCAVQYPVSSGSYVGIVTGLLGLAGGIAGTIASGGALAPALMGAGASVGVMHTNVSHTGSISSNAGAMGIKKPYLIIERPQPKLPTNGVNIEGKPENKTLKLSSLHGYVKVKKAHYDGIACTSNELDNIKGLLTSGVYIN